MPNPLMLEGEYEAIAETDSLADRIAQLELRLDQLEKSIPQSAVVLLLNVLHQAMRDIAQGKYKIDAPVENTGKWDVIKSRLAPRLRECVDLLLIQKHMKRTQIAAALKMDYSNCTKNVISVLLRQGLLKENGGELFLREL